MRHDIVEPRDQQRPPAREYALVQSELYFGGQDKVGDLTKMTNKDPDWIVWNGYANGGAGPKQPSRRF